MKDNESICSECDEKINDDTETKWDLHADPYCEDCYRVLNEEKWAEERRKGEIKWDLTYTELTQ